MLSRSPVLFVCSCAFLFLAPAKTVAALGELDVAAEQSLRERALAEPIVAMGGEPTKSETVALTVALRAYGRRKSPDDFSSLTGFLEQHPNSAWNAALLTDLGIEYYNTAHYSKAIEVWARAWELAKDAKEPRAKAIADRAVGELAYMYARLGRIQELSTLLKAVEGRTFVGPATERIAGARDGLWNMQNRPEISFRCGPLALHRIKAITAPSPAADLEIHNSASTQRGTSLPQVAELSKKIGLNYQMAFRAKGAALIVPAVVHWKVGHYAAMTRRNGDRYLLQDPTFINDTWATADALDSEASGYFLVPPGPLPKGWRSVDVKEGENIWGKGNVGGQQTTETTPDSPATTPCNPEGKRMAVPRVHLLVVSLNINDSPVGYRPPVGPAIEFTVRYNHREAFQPSTFTYANFGPKWTCDWISYINDNPQNPSADVNYYVRGGGTRIFTGFDTNTQRFAPQMYDQTRLTRTGPAGYEILAGNGAKLIFSRSDGAIGTSRKIFLTQVVDPAGNTVTLNYDGSLRLTNIVDAIGQATTLSYTASDTYKITRITDPFGRFATFEYDSLGRLTNITDVIGIKSGFSYETSTDFISALVTPYGTTRFLRGSSGTTRWLEVMYPDSSRERVEFNQASNLGIPFSEPPNLVPQGMNTFNQWLYARNTYYWSRTACATAYGDYTKARIYHWLHSPDLSTAMGALESIKEPLEGRVWFDYPGQSSALTIGTSDKPKRIGRVLDEGQTQLYTYDYDEFGHITNSVDPLGRTFSYIYATNGTDLLEKRMTRAGKNELVFKTTYNAQHQPLTHTDAAGQTTTNTYNARGQLLTRTNPKGETRSYTYDPNGYLIAIGGPLAGTNDTVTATYDSLGRTLTKTDASGYTITLGHDALDRITNISYPDGTFEQITYSRLDPVMLQDRAGRQSFHEYDALGQLVTRIDPDGKATRFQWCSCGAIRSMTDPMGRTTEWQTDVQSRLVAKQYGDGSKIAYLYEPLSGRARQIIDEKLQTKQLSYNRDNTLRSIAYLNPAVPTPTVSFTYDADYERMTSMTDGSGTTVYSYLPITGSPSPGAGKLASADGPLPDDTVTYTYDEAGRRVTSAIAGVASARTLDAGRRVSAVTNALGAFSFVYDGSSGRVLSETFPNGQVTTRTYGNNSGDNWLQRITHHVGATPVSEFVYGRDIARARINTWSQQFGSGSPDIYSFNYDADDQLISAAITNSGALVKGFAYQYDPAGNRLLEAAGPATNTATYNALNQISTATGLSPGRTLEWDAENQLRAVNAGNTRTEFAYDGLSRLISIRLLTNGIEASFRRFVWQADQLAQERDAGGAVVKRFFSQGVKIESGPNAGVYFYTRDHLGSIREVTDASGNVRARYSYDPFGRRTRISSDIDADFGFTGIFWSPEAGLLLARYRAYDPDLGRWLSRDPLRKAELREGPNLYAYVKNNPVNAVDPLGLCCEKEKQEIEDLEEIIDQLCQAEFDNADRNCAFIAVHPDDPWKYTCRDTQLDAQKRCADIEKKYHNKMVSRLADYYVCLFTRCTKPPCKEATLGPDDDGGYDCNESGGCTASTGRPAERSAAETTVSAAPVEDQ